jgi:hypothetical protein
LGAKPPREDSAINPELSTHRIIGIEKGLGARNSGERGDER